MRYRGHIFTDLTEDTPKLAREGVLWGVVREYKNLAEVESLKLLFCVYYRVTGDRDTSSIDSIVTKLSYVTFDAHTVAGYVQ